MVKKLVAKVIAALLRKKPVTGAPVTEPSAAAMTRERADVDAAVRVLVDIDQYGRLLAGDDPVLRRVLGGFELTLAQQFGRQVRRAPEDQ